MDEVEQGFRLRGRWAEAHFQNQNPLVLELGCGKGDLLAALCPSIGVGVDFSPEIIQRARMLHPDITFVEADCHNLQILEGPFDAIILSDLVNDIWDVQEVFAQLPRLCMRGHASL